MYKTTILTIWTTLMILVGACTVDSVPDLSPANWEPGVYDRFMAAQDVDRTQAGFARGQNGAVTVAYSGLAAQAGLEALKQGGNAIDGAMTAAMTQIALTAGAPISYFGMMSLVYYDAESDAVYTMNAEWNTVKGEDDPMSIPGKIGFSADSGLSVEGEPSGRTALVGGFMKGVGEAHARFGSLPFAQLFEPSIYIAEQGMPVTRMLAGQIEYRRDALARLPETKAIFFGPDGKPLTEGDVLRQPQLAETLRAIAENGTDYMYSGPWAEKLVAAVQADGGKMTLDDLAAYEVIWSEPLVGDIGNGFEIYTNPWPNAGGIAMIEAQNMAIVSGLVDEAHWTESGASLAKAVTLTSAGYLGLLPEETRNVMFPGIEFTPESRVTTEHAEKFWAAMAAMTPPPTEAPDRPKHSDDVVVIDKDGNIAAITHTINTVYWGGTGIFVDGISISDAAAIQQAAVAAAGPGERLPAPTQTGILFKDGLPVLGFASMGSGLHNRTFQGLINFTRFGMGVEDAINTPDFYMSLPTSDGGSILGVPEGRFDADVLEASGLDYREVPNEEARLGGEGKWIAISRDPETGLLEAASHNRNNSDAVAF